MRKYRVRLLFLLIFYFGYSGAFAQNCVSINNNAFFNFSCGVNCGPVNLQVPDLRTTSDYAVATIPYNPFPYVTAGGNEITSIYVDDVYSGIINIPFGFCFYDSVFNKCVVGSNGLITFDTLNASCGNSWQQTQPIFYSGGTICSSGAAYYPRSSIMGVFTDLFPVALASPPDRRIEWRVEGAAPCRRFIVSYYNVGMFGAGNYSVGGTNCNSLNPSIFQIVLYESTGIIDVFILQKICNATSNPGGGNAILGVQNWTRDAAVAAPGKNATPWTAQNEGYRFTPSGGTSRFINSQLYTLGGTLVSTAVISGVFSGLLDLSFPNVCPAGASEQFLVRTSYASCNDPNITFITEDTITVNKTNTLNATATPTDINCATGVTGSITVNVPNGGGVPPYQYSINGGPLQASNIFPGLLPGTYTVFATDPNGCSSTINNVAITRTGSLGVGTTAINTSCAGVNNGSITVFPPSFYTPIQYAINGGPPQLSNIFTNLAPGVYSITVADAIGCTGASNVTVNQGIALTANIATTTTACSGVNNGTITVTPTNGTAPYQYSLNGGPLQAGNVFNGLAAATYTIAIFDALGCSVNNLSATVIAGAALNASLVKTDISCNGGANGTITINITNGNAPYQYSLDNINWQGGNTFTGLAANTYTVYYRDNNACGGSQAITISQPQALNASVAMQAALCFGQNNGVITIAASGGVSPYQFSLDGVNYQPANIFNTTAGTYTVYVRDNNGCINTQNITITQPNALSANSVAINATCNGGNDGRITVTSAGGMGTHQYSIDGINFQSSNVFNVAPGLYTITVKDANNCVITATPVTVGLTNNLTVTPTVDITICEGSSAQLNLTTNGNQFAWTPAATLNNSSIQNPVAAPTATTQYIAAITFGRCTINDTIIVNVNPAPIPDAGPDGDICYGQTFQLLGSGGVQFLWSPAGTLSNTAISNPVSNPAQTITYSLSVTGANGCASLVQDQMTVKVTPPIIVRTYPSDTVVYAGDQFQLLAASAGTNYTWNPPLGLSNSGIPDPVLTVSTDITFTVTATTSAGCRGDGMVNVKVYKGPDIYVPTGFTPNGDGRNDRFKPFPVGIRELNYFRVYNRWGQLIFSTKTLHDGWDGRIGGIDQQTGTYAWMVQGITRDGKIITKKGTVTLIR